MTTRPDLTPEAYARIMADACRGQSVEEASRCLARLLARRDALLRVEAEQRTVPPQPFEALAPRPVRPA